MAVDRLARKGRGFLGEFREFALRGNVVDLAVGVIIGASFGKIISTLVDNVIMPPLGLLIGQVDFSRLAWELKPDDHLTEAIDPVAIQYGLLINAVVQFALVAFVVFLLVRLINRMRAHEAAQDAAKPAEPAAPTASEALLAEIRDLLKNK